MPRHTDWQQRMAAVIKESIGKPFVWGEHDCCLFAADCCIAVCGVDPAEDYRGHYTTEAGAKRALKARHGSLEAAWDACFERVDVAMAGRGDVVLYESPYGRSVAVVWAGDYWSVSADGDGAIRAQCTPLVAWRVE